MNEHDRIREFFIKKIGLNPNQLAEVESFATTFATNRAEPAAPETLPDGRVSEQSWNRMSDAERWAYARRFSQPNAHVFRPLRDAEKARECWQGGPTPRRSRLFSRNPWRAVGIG